MTGTSVEGTSVEGTSVEGAEDAAAGSTGPEGGWPGAVVVGFVPTDEGRAALARGVEEARLRSVGLVVASTRRAGDADQPLDTSGVDVDHEVRELSGPDPVDELVQLAEEVGAGVLVIGLRRRSPVGKLVLGTNAQRLLLEAPCPVLAVKPDAT